MGKLTQGMSKLWKDPLALIIIIMIITTILLGEPKILFYELVIVNLIFFGLLFYYSWFQPEKLIEYFSTHDDLMSSRIRKSYGDLNESRIFIPYTRFCAIVGLPIFSWVLYKLIR
jgi:hypothetical protein